MPKPNHKASPNQGIDLSAVQIFAEIEDVESGFRSTIVEVYRETVRERSRLVAELDGITYPVLLGDSSVRKLIRAFGRSTNDWIGKTVEVIHDDFLKDGESISYLVVRPV